jgi:Replication-relaxation
MASHLLLTPRDEEILRAVHYYRYVTARDIAQQQFSKTSLNYTRELMTRLSGKTDLDANNYLCRFALPTTKPNRPEKVFVLGAKGIRLLRGQGFTTSWYFRPYKLKFLSYSYTLHNLILTRTMIAAAQWAKTHPTYSLTDKRISYELSGKVIPDGWLMFEEETKEGTYKQPVILELDRGMEHKPQFKAHVRGRINYIQSGEYKRTFNTDYFTI